MEVRLARYFLAITDHGTLSRAAEALHMTQPALSQAVTSLERELGAPLFERTPRGMRLTVSGQALLEPARRLVEASQAARTAVENASGAPAGTLHVATTPGLVAFPLSRAVGRLRELYPQTSVFISPFTGEVTLERSFEVETLELVLAHYVGPVPADVQHADIGQQELVLVAPPEVDLPDGDVDWDTLTRLPLVASPPNTSMRQLLEATAAEVGRDLDIAVETEHMDSFFTLVASGVGCAVVPTRSIERFGAGLQHRRLDAPLLRPYSIYFRTARLSVAGRALVRILSAGRVGDDTAMLTPIV